MRHVDANRTSWSQAGYAFLKNPLHIEAAARAIAEGPRRKSDGSEGYTEGESTIEGEARSLLLLIQLLTCRYRSSSVTSVQEEPKCE
jgi:hypothetical protein